mgnify:CR=1 FL=1
MSVKLPKISVILTTYNSAEYIEQVLESILGQNGLDEKFELELLVIDDCSSDNTQEVLKGYDIILHTTPKNSGGPNLGRNIGLSNATGDYICIVDHDDQWMPNKLLKQLEVSHLAPIISSGYNIIDKSTGTAKTKVNQSGEPYILYKKNVTFFNKLLKIKSGQNIYLGSMMYSADLKSILFEERYGMVDYDWLLRLFEEQKAVEVNEPLYNRIVMGSNLSLNESYRIKDFYYSLSTLEDFSEKYPEQCKIAYKRVHGTLARYYYQIGKMKESRTYFKKSEWSFKTMMYYLTSFIGHSYVKRKFNVFG